MGQASGKFVVPHIAANKSDSNAVNSPATPTETASQLVNGDASVLSNVPAIDDVEPSTNDPKKEVIEAVDNGNGPNGTVHTTDEEGDTRKKSNPLDWLKRRLSKKSISSKTSLSDDSSSHPNVQETTNGTPENEIKVTAHSLVSEILTEVAAEHGQVTSDVVEPVSEVPSVSEEESQAVEATSQPVLNDTPAEPSVETEIPESSQPNEVEVQDVEQNAVLDTNNTNVAIEQEVADTSDSIIEAQEAALSKLNELELTNGHPAEDIPEGEHSDVDAE